ncbi:MAG: hypothetical protein KAG20_01670 [Cocleimonas sp.]|nr:hypothetical protein [Cocleimonas sp.]
MLNKILLKLLKQGVAIDPLREDAFETPSYYTGYILPLRYLLALRYLKHKYTVLDEFRQEGVFPVTVEQFTPRIIERLNKKNTIPPASSFLSSPLKAWVFYPLLISTLVISIGFFNNWLADQRLQAMLANRLPYYSDLQHRALVFKYSGYEAAHKQVLTEIKHERDSILKQLPDKGNLKAVMEKGLIQLTNKQTSSEKIMLDFKAVNSILDQHNLPYYITPKVLQVNCSSFVDAPLDEILTLKKMESILSGGHPEQCHTTMLTVYHVAKRNQLMHGKVELPLFHVRRIDKVPAVDGALGLTFSSYGIGSIILLDRIKEFATDSVIPALTFQGRNTLIPFWLQGYYDVEEVIYKQYKQTLNDIYQNKTEIKQLKAMAKQLLKNKQQMATSRMRQTLQRADGTSNQGVLGGGLDAISTILGGLNKEDSTSKQKQKEIDFTILDKLNNSLLPSIEYHEAYHQIDKSKWKEPVWVADIFKTLSDNGKEHALEELGAYLTQLTYTKKGADIWLTKLLFFSLNSMMRNQPEFYSSSIILDSMNSLYLGKAVKVNYSLSVNEKIKIHKTFVTMDKASLKIIAEKAYRELFKRPVPEMK